MHRNDQCCECHPRPKSRRLLFARLMPVSRSHAQARTLRAMERNGDHLRSADIECRRRARRQPMIQRASAASWHALSRRRLIMLGAGAAAGALAGLSPQRATAGLTLDGTQGDGRVKAEFRLWDVFAGQQLHGQQYTTTPDNWRRIALAGMVAAWRLH